MVEYLMRKGESGIDTRAVHFFKPTPVIKVNGHICTLLPLSIHSYSENGATGIDDNRVPPHINAHPSYRYKRHRHFARRLFPANADFGAMWRDAIFYKNSSFQRAGMDVKCTRTAYTSTSSSALRWYSVQSNHSGICA